MLSGARWWERAQCTERRPGCLPGCFWCAPCRTMLVGYKHKSSRRACVRACTRAGACSLIGWLAHCSCCSMRVWSTYTACALSGPVCEGPDPARLAADFPHLVTLLRGVIAANGWADEHKPLRLTIATATLGQFASAVAALGGEFPAQPWCCIWHTCGHAPCAVHSGTCAAALFLLCHTVSMILAHTVHTALAAQGTPARMHSRPRRAAGGSCPRACCTTRTCPRRRSC